MKLLFAHTVFIFSCLSACFSVSTELHVAVYGNEFFAGKNIDITPRIDGKEFNGAPLNMKDFTNWYDEKICDIEVPNNATCKVNISIVDHDGKYSTSHTWEYDGYNRYLYIINFLPNKKDNWQFITTDEVLGSAQTEAFFPETKKN